MSNGTIDESVSLSRQEQAAFDSRVEYWSAVDADKKLSPDEKQQRLKALLYLSADTLDRAELKYQAFLKEYEAEFSDKFVAKIIKDGVEVLLPIMERLLNEPKVAEASAKPNLSEGEVDVLFGEGAVSSKDGILSKYFILDINNHDRPRSIFWCLNVCFLALWKSFKEHRKSWRGPIHELTDYPKADRVIAVWEKGCDLLDRIAAAKDYKFKNPFINENCPENKHECSIEELAFYIFTRSHLAWKKNKEGYQLKCEVPQAAIRRLLDYYDGKDRLPDTIKAKTETVGNIKASYDSIAASTQSLNALLDWALYHSYNCFDKKSHTIAIDETIKACMACYKRGLAAIVGEKLPEGGWPAYFKPAMYCEDTIDFRATCEVYYCLERHRTMFMEQLADNDTEGFICCFIDQTGLHECDVIAEAISENNMKATKMYLRSEARKALDKLASISKYTKVSSIDQGTKEVLSRTKLLNIENISRALVSLVPTSKSDCILDVRSGINVIHQSVSNKPVSDAQGNANPASESISLSIIWGLYGMIEILRRKDWYDRLNELM